VFESRERSVRRSGYTSQARGDREFFEAGHPASRPRWRRERGETAGVGDMARYFRDDQRTFVSSSTTEVASQRELLTSILEATWPVRGARQERDQREQNETTKQSR